MHATLSPFISRTGTGALVSPPAAPGGYRRLVADLAADVATVTPAAVLALPPALPALRAAVVDVLWILPEGPGPMPGALARLAACLEDAAAGLLINPRQLSAALAGVVNATIDTPPSRSIAVNYAVKHLIGVIAATSGRLLGEGKRLALLPAAPLPSAPTARRHVDYAVVAAGACATAALLALDFFH